MKYYLCNIGSFEGSDKILEDCLRNNTYQYHEATSQKGAGNKINKEDTLILVYQKRIIAYGVSTGSISSVNGYSSNWLAVPVDKWVTIDFGESFSLPYGVFWHTLAGNKQSVVKQIDELWANEIIMQIVLRNKERRESASPALYLHLGTIVAFFKNSFLAIPPVQRGKIWNATRVEVLWDSLLRGIPIGSLVVRPNSENNNWELMDGQQRVNAISLGYQEFKKDSSILWLDLLPDKEDSIKNNSDRKFFFRVTTTAHPWGYHFSDDETSNKTLSTHEKRQAVARLKEIDREWISNQGNRPSPLELWPFTASFPVPFSILRAFLEQKPDSSFEHFWKECGCSPVSKDSNWFIYFDKKMKEHNLSNEIEGKTWLDIKKAINNTSSTIVVAQNSSTIGDKDDIGLYFKRMNKSGIVPSNEEIRYSLLKSRLPELKELDDIANGCMRPSRMADIAMVSYLVQKKRRWISEISNKDVLALSEDKDFSTYIKGQQGKESLFRSLIHKVEKWILFDKEKNPNGLPRFLFSSIAKTGRGDVYKLLLILAQNWDSLDSTKLVALVSIINWFGNEAMISYGYDKYYKDCLHTQTAWDDCTKSWVFEATAQNNHITPPPPSIVFNTSFGNKQEALSYRYNQAYIYPIDKMWEWTSYSGRALLLYVCRDYLFNEFGQYDPSDAAWCEENCPWDYDHIVPQSWIKYGRGAGDFHDVVRVFVNSIGNIAPISFEKNREKQDNPPSNCKYLDIYKDDLKIIPSDYDLFQRSFEDDGKLSILFASITAKRFYNIYKSWFDTLNIDNMFLVEDKRRLLLKSIEQKLSNDNISCIIVFTNDNLQYTCLCNVDWAHQWLAIGIDLGEDKGVFPAVAIGNNSIEVGLRRHPNKSDIDGKNIWYKDSISIPFEFSGGKEGLSDDLSRMLIELMQVIDQLKNDPASYSKWYDIYKNN